MFRAKNYKTGFQIEKIASCDFSTMREIDNEFILNHGGREQNNKRLLQFATKKMGIKRRFWAHPDQDSLDLSRQALTKLIKKDPKIVEEAEFFIFAGISNAMPTVCQSALLAGEYNFQQASCWDIKSGCSTGVLALIQALEWFDRGAKKGVIVCAETFSKFTAPEIIQMGLSIGDGAVALTLKADSNFSVLGAIHGTNPAYLKTMYVPGVYPIDIENYNPQDYKFCFSEKADTVTKMAFYWKESLKEVLEISEISGYEINHYIAHQVDGSKNMQFAKEADIDETAIATNFEMYGNMGCPTIFINYESWIESGKKINKGESICFHAVGGGLSWASLILKKEK
jgi:3-oxoacyl-[acyl-carrier-protein] synthase III